MAGFTDQEVSTWFAENQGKTKEQIKEYMDKNGVSVAQVARVLGGTEDQVQKIYDATGPVQNTTVVPSDISQAGVTKQPNNVVLDGVNSPSSTSNVDNKTLLEQAARGNVAVPGANLRATPINMDGTLTQLSALQQIQPTQTVYPVSSSPPPTVSANTATAEQAAQQDNIAATLIKDVAQVEKQNPVDTVTGTVSDNSIAKNVAVDKSQASVQAATVDQLPGASVEAAIGNMPAGALAEAAKVAGLETARIQSAKNQLRRAGLTEDQIAAFGNDPTAMEMKLSDFTDEQKKIIGGLPTEALVSTQMEQLLNGIQNGEIPVWAKPAVATVDSVLARRGLRASTIGRDALANTIIQAAMPIAQSNAESIKQSVMQQRDIAAQGAVAEAQLKTQVALDNAQKTFNLSLTNLSNEQQARIANSQFMQTVSLANATNRQQAAIQTAVNLVNLDTAQLDSNTRIAVENAKSFLAMDMQNLSNEQQGVLIDAQFEQQRLLSNASAKNVAAQFNASTENQTAQFMANLKATIDQFNIQQRNAIGTFNATEKNKVDAINAGNQVAAQQFAAQQAVQIREFNAQKQLEVEQFNATNAQAIEQSNIQWRRQANTAETAATNAILQQNVQNAYGLTAQAQAATWQELRDAATFVFQGGENKENREAQLYASAIGNEAAAGHNYDQTKFLVDLAKSVSGG